ncbi:MAG: YraN family protein [Candidatus Omnitrophica bacterium]|nr:YraN family protein [Candidatus Omnitrophota bacterium]MDD5737390.1 YraN family protein [Candidatus Omnitrophota bacterium]
MRKKELGDLGEDLAARYLTAHGYVILEKKFRCRSGEIDIIALDKEVLVFVEVRSRSDEEHGMPYETVNGIKRRHIRRVALTYQARHGLLEHDSRFDCVSVVFIDEDNVKSIELIKDAFWS